MLLTFCSLLKINVEFVQSFNFVTLIVFGYVIYIFIIVPLSVLLYPVLTWMSVLKHELLEEHIRLNHPTRIN